MPLNTGPFTNFSNFPSGPSAFGMWEDFDNEYTTAFVLGSSPWISTALAAGTIVQTTDEKFGVAVLSAAATTDNSGIQIQQDMNCYTFVAGKDSYFLNRFKLSDGTEDEYLAGICITDTTLLDGTGTLAAGLTFTHGIGFYKPDGESNIYGFVRNASSQLATGAYAITGTSYNVLSFKVTMDPNTAGTGKVTYYVNGTIIGSIDSTQMPYDTGSNQFTPSIAFNSGNASGTKTATVDYIGALQER